LYANGGQEHQAWEYMQIGLAWAAKMDSPALVSSTLCAMLPLALRLKYYGVAEIIGHWMLETVEKLDLGERDKVHRQAFAIRVQSAACLAQERYEEAQAIRGSSIVGFAVSAVA